MVYTVRWIGFGLSHSLARTVVHFFPSSNVVTAPYPVNTKIQVLSTGAGDHSVILEGARLHQPDGVRMEAAFPTLAQGTGIYAVVVEITGASQRIDLTASQCIVEIVTANGKIRYRPSEVSGSANNTEPISSIAYSDASVKSSLVFVNTSARALEVSGLDNQPYIIAAAGVTECPLSSNFFESGVSYQSERDVHYSASIKLPPNVCNSEITTFLMERDVSTDRVIGINQINFT
jgi:hypothetical protein